MINATEDFIWATISDFGCSIPLPEGHYISGYAGECRLKWWRGETQKAEKTRD
jgi:hypothetical protein